MENLSKVHFTKINEMYGEVIKHSYQSQYAAKLANMFQFSEDLNSWCEVLSHYTDTTLLISALHEFELGFQAAVSGQYRFAFSANRYFVEQVCKFIYLSSNEFHLRQWKGGFRDISWNSITDNDSGIFSVNYIRVFYSEIESEGKHIFELISKLYRETSEFVHGNFLNIRLLPKNIEFNESLLEKWLSNMETAKFVAIFLLCMRFSKGLNKKELGVLEDSIRDELCGIEEFNLLFIKG